MHQKKTLLEHIQKKFGITLAHMDNIVYTDVEEFMAVLTEEDNAQIDALNEVFKRLTQEFSCELGKQESRRERQEKGIESTNLTYGEIEFKSFCQVFKWIQKTWKDKDPDCWHNAFNVPGGTFIDLGHGTGKGILSGTFMH